MEPVCFQPPGGTFLVGYLEDEPVACGAWRLRSDVWFAGTQTTAEIKRMYVAPAARGRGLARDMLGRLERTARDAGAEAIILETGRVQPEAIGLYESWGYTPIPGFGFHRSSPLTRCYGKAMIDLVEMQPR